MSSRNLWGYVSTSAGLFSSIGGVHFLGQGRLWSPLALLAAALVLVVVGWRLLLIEATPLAEAPRAREGPATADDPEGVTPSARA